MLFACRCLYRNSGNIKTFFENEENRACVGLLFVIAIIGTLFALNIAATASAVSPKVLGVINVTCFSPILLVGFALVLKNSCGEPTLAGKKGSLAIFAFAIAAWVPNIIMLSDCTLLSVEITGGITAATMLLGGGVLGYKKIQSVNKIQKQNSFRY